MKNEYGVIIPKELQIEHYIQKFNKYVQEAIATGENNFEVYASDDLGLCNMFSKLERYGQLEELFSDYNIYMTFDDYDNVRYVYVSW